LKAMLDRNVLILAAVFVATCALGLTPWVYSDGVGDYSWIRSVVIDRSLDCRNEFEHFVSDFMKRYGWSGPTNDLYPATTETGYQPNKYPIGTAILWSPFFLTAHAYAHVASALGYDIKPDGYSFPYIFAISFASCLYGFVGLLLTYLVLKSYYSRKAALIAVVTLWFATSVPVYMYLNPSMPHATSLFAISLFVYWWLRVVRKSTEPRIRDYVVLGLLGGFATMVRVENVMFLFAALADLAVRSIQQGKMSEGERNILRRLWPLGLAAACSILAFLPQLVVWKIVFGKILFEPYAETSMLVAKSKGLSWPLNPKVTFGYTRNPITLAPILHYFSHPYLLDTFFSSSHGLFVWTPVYIPATVGLFFFAKRYGRTAVFMLLGLFAFIYFVSCSNQATGASYGNRYLMSPLIVFALGLGFVTEWLLSKVRLRYVVAVAGLLIVWNALLIVQYSTGMINRKGPVPLKKMFGNQFYAAPSRLVRIGLTFLTKRSETYQQHRQSGGQAQE